MLISIGNDDLSIDDTVVNLLTKNPFKFPRPSDMNPVLWVGEHKEPAIPFTVSVNFIYEKCMEFLLKRLSHEMQQGPTPNGIKRTVFLYPWQFVATAYLRGEAGEMTTTKLHTEIIPQRVAWSKFFFLEISEATIKYKPKK